MVNIMNIPWAFAAFIMSMVVLAVVWAWFPSFISAVTTSGSVTELVMNAALYLLSFFFMALPVIVAVDDDQRIIKAIGLKS